MSKQSQVLCEGIALATLLDLSDSYARLSVRHLVTQYPMIIGPRRASGPRDGALLLASILAIHGKSKT
eukprot:767096-Hanusia_phi.AAC.10